MQLIYISIMQCKFARYFVKAGEKQLLLTVRTDTLVTRWDSGPGRYNTDNDRLAG